MLCNDVELKKQPFNNTFGLLADGHQETSRERMLGDDHLTSVHCRAAVRTEMYQETLNLQETNSFAFSIFLSEQSLVNQCCLNFQIELAIHSELWHLQSIHLQGSQSLEFEATGPNVHLGMSQRRQMFARGRFLMSKEETDVAQCRWTSDCSSKSRHILQTEFKISLGATDTFTIVPSYVRVCLLQKWRVGDPLNSYWSFYFLSLPAVVVSLPPCFVPGVSLLFYEPLNLCTKRLQVLLGIRKDFMTQMQH